MTRKCNWKRKYVFTCHFYQIVIYIFCWINKLLLKYTNSYLNSGVYEYSFDENKMKHYNLFSTGLGSGVEISKYLSLESGSFCVFFVSVACHDVLIR